MNAKLGILTIMEEQNPALYPNAIVGGRAVSLVMSVHINNVKRQAEVVDFFGWAHANQEMKYLLATVLKF